MLFAIFNVKCFPSAICVKQDERIKKFSIKIYKKKVTIIYIQTEM